MARVILTDSEKKMLDKVRRSVQSSYEPYDFWFVYDENELAIGWEGGFNLGQAGQFRNQYTIQKGKQIKQNWENK